MDDSVDIFLKGLIFKRNKYLVIMISWYFIVPLSLRGWTRSSTGTLSELLSLTRPTSTTPALSAPLKIATLSISSSGARGVVYFILTNYSIFGLKELVHISHRTCTHIVFHFFSRVLQQCPTCWKQESNILWSGRVRLNIWTVASLSFPG